MAAKQRRIMRDYRKSTPGRFVPFCQKVKLALTDNPHYPEAMWGSNGGVRQQFFDKVDQLVVSSHLASDGARSLIRDRDRLMEEVVVLLDQLASLLEAASHVNPDALYTTGFNIAQERRSPNRTRIPLVAPPDFTVSNSPESRKAVASCSTMPGVYNHEIQINLKDPGVEADWGHNGIFPDCHEMAMYDLTLGNNFMRSRYHGPEGPGPWSAVVSIIIT